MRTARMHPAHLVLIGVALALAIGVPTTHYVITKVYDNAACVVELQPIQQTREMTVIEWPLTRAEEPIPAPRRSVQRKRQTLIPPSMPAVEQCAPPPGFYGPGEPQVQHVPEPSSLPLALAGLAGVFALRRKEGKQ